MHFMNRAAYGLRLIRIFELGIAAVVVLACVGIVAARADENTFTLKQPLDNATVRETVPIRVPRNDLAQATYATIYIDNIFRSAPAVPDSGETIFSWDTKSSFSTPDQPDQQQPTLDGPHTIVVHLFDKDSNEISMATSTVRVANKITSLPDGVHLVYKWRQNEDATYAITSKLISDKNTLLSADVKLDRSVEDVNGNEILLRDLIQGSGYVTAGYSGTSGSQDADSGDSTPVSTAYSPGSKYWTVDKFGALLADNKPIALGNHFGMPVPEFPARRVNIGDSWQTHMLVSLQWAVNKPTFLTGTSRLDSFEWQNHYPTAKIIETYTGPAKFFIDGGDSTAPVDGGNVQVQRTVWFAYEAGIVIRVETSVTANPKMSSAQYSALSAVQGSSGGRGLMNPGQGRVARSVMRQQGADPDAIMDNSLGANIPGAPMIQRNPFNQARTQQDQQTPVNLVATSTMTLISVQG